MKKVQNLILLAAVAVVSFQTASYAQLVTCCLPDRCIEVIEVISCLGLGGTPTAGLGLCDTVCPGACCLPTGECTPIPKSPCESNNGSFAGVGVPCGNVCVGACCLPDGNCGELEGADCFTSGGNYQGLGATCEIGLCSDPVSTAFTYQGQLSLNGVPVNDTADFTFLLYSDSVGEPSITQTSVNSVDVVDGLFSVELDFGVDGFNGDDRWLEIDVRSPAGSGSFETLSPRTHLTATPYAMQTRGLYVDDAFNVGIGTTNPTEKLSVIGDIHAVGEIAATTDTTTSAGILRTYGPNGNINVDASWLSGSPDHGFMSVRNASGDSRVAQWVGSDRGGKLYTKGPNGNDNIRLTNDASSPNHGYLAIRDSSGDDRVSHMVNTDGVGIMSTKGPNGSENIRMTYLAGSPDHGYLAVKDANGSDRVTQFVGADGGGNIRVKDTDGDTNFIIQKSSNTTPTMIVRGDATGPVAVFRNYGTSSAQGIMIRIDNPSTNKNNNFITFRNGESRITGRIEGFDLENGDWTPPPVTFDVNLDLNFSPGSLPSLSFFPTELDPGSLPSFGANVFTFTPPTVSQLQSMYTWANSNGVTGLFTLDPVSLAVTALKITAAQNAKDEGVTYGSKGADYAEWLPKLDPADTFQMGQIVGVYGGKISLNTEGADNIMAISYAPVVLGNFPDPDRADDFEKIAFMGQIQVVVRGHVDTGDYIVASGLEDGTAIAVKSDDLKLEHLGQILGRAWSDSESDIYGFVNVLVGVDHEASAVITHRQAEKLDAQMLENAALRADLEDLRASMTELMQLVQSDRK